MRQNHWTYATGSGAKKCNSKVNLAPDGTLDLEIPRDREGSFEPQIIKKHQTRITSMDDQILSLYAKGMTNREIVAFFKEMQRKLVMTISVLFESY